MNDQNDSLEKAILDKLNVHYAVGEGKLFHMLNVSDSKDEQFKFSVAVGVLYRKGLVDIVADPTKTMRVVRLKQILIHS